ncbi:MAG TPA: antitoxin VapB family protein [Anaerovoracaceae bacterium]|nr:antitoxin VapB family protein [Anaerovoracaceae bacterium]
MATKTISIRDDVYIILKSLKKEGESFSDVIDMLAQKKKKKRTDIGEYFGALKGSKILDEIEDDCNKIRAAARQRA